MAMLSEAWNKYFTTVDSRIVKLFYGIVILLFILFNPNSTLAYSLKLVKDINNPLNTNFYILQSAVSKENNQYKMWFTGHNGLNLKIGYATSIDGINWPSSDFVSVSDGGDNHDPSIFKHNGNTYIYYISEPSEGSGVDIQIKRATANGPQLSNLETIAVQRQPWNSQKLSCPYGYYENGTYFLLYCGTDGGNWTIGIATSSNGTTFTPCINNPIITGSNLGNSQIFVDQDGIRHLLYHSGSGIEEATSTGDLTCMTQWSGRGLLLSRTKDYDQTQIIAPSLLSDTTPKELFYTARGPSTGNGWKLNRAIENTNKPKIVIIPGFFASWNGDAVLHNMSTTLNDWRIPSYVHEYDGLIKTLENLGYVYNVDYYIFAYDWRRPLSESADDLHSFLQSNIWNFEETDSVKIIGHSMGGLLGRIYLQKYPNDRTNKVITVGAPHRGVVQVYQPLEAGETRRDDSFLWLGTKLLINLNRRNFRNDREVVRAVIPSLYDLFPTYDFLRNKKGNLIPFNSLSIQNNSLREFSNTESIDSKMTVIYGNKTTNQTPKEIVVGNRAVVDHLSKDYSDGRPLNYVYGEGDYLVPFTSSKLGTDPVPLIFDHGELVYKSDAIKQVLRSLDVQYTDSQIQEGNATKLSPSLLITAQSPIDIKVESGGNIYSSEGGIIFVPNAESGTYRLHVKKLDQGDYTITLAQIAESNDVWETFTGQITQTDVEEEDIYEIQFNMLSAKPQVSEKNCSKIKTGHLNLKHRQVCKIKIHNRN